jgi:hypothetical protein
MRHPFIALLSAGATGLLPLQAPAIDQVSSVLGHTSGCARCGGAHTQGDGPSVIAPGMGVPPRATEQTPDGGGADPTQANGCHVEVRETIYALEYYKVCP